MKNTIPQSKFWIYLAAILLSFNGGFINAATLISYIHDSVGYVTGNLVFSGTLFASHEWLLFFEMLLLIFCFLGGAILSGFMIKTELYHKDYRYELNLLVQLVLVVIAMFLMLHHISYFAYFLALAMGMQNAMTTHYGTALIRTTHMTGTMTDLGILLAHWIKGSTVQVWKISLYALLIISFLGGAMLGAWLFIQVHAYSLLLSVLIYLIMIFTHKL